jgi:hypothetical protein
MHAYLGHFSQFFIKIHTQLLDMFVFGLMLKFQSFSISDSILLTVKFQFCTRFASPKVGAERIRAFLCLVGFS